jgi:cysteine-rich repeat protein
MMTRTSLLLLLCPLLSACPDDGTSSPYDLTTGSTGASSSFGDLSTSTGIPTSETSDSTGPDTTGAILTTGEDSTSTSTTGTTGSESSTGEDGSSSSGSSSTGNDPFVMVCGDAYEDLYEQCDDGNTVDGDGCKGDCARWDWYGVKKYQIEAEMFGWSECWSGTYEGGGEVSDILAACNKGQIAFGCRAIGMPYFNRVAHGNRGAVTSLLDPVNNIEDVDGYRLVNGSKWQWTETKIAYYINPQQENCTGDLCWPVSSGHLLPGGTCGDVYLPVDKSAEYERVVLQSPY